MQIPNFMCIYYNIMRFFLQKSSHPTQGEKFTQSTTKSAQSLSNWTSSCVSAVHHIPKTTRETSHNNNKWDSLRFYEKMGKWHVLPPLSISTRLRTLLNNESLTFRGILSKARGKWHFLKGKKHSEPKTKWLLTTR